MLKRQKLVLGILFITFLSECLGSAAAQSVCEDVEEPFVLLPRLFARRLPRGGELHVNIVAGGDRPHEVGSLSFRYQPGAKSFIMIEHIEIRLSERCKGYGQAAFAGTLEEGSRAFPRIHGFALIVDTLNPDRAAAVHIYRKYGFRKLEPAKDGVLMKSLGRNPDIPGGYDYMWLEALES